MKYVAMLRGINVGGNKKVQMASLKDQFLKRGFKEVQTVLNTGNVIFDSTESFEDTGEKVNQLLLSNYAFKIPFFLSKADPLVDFFDSHLIEESHNRVEEGQKILFTFVNNLIESELTELKSIDKFDIIKKDGSFICIKYFTKTASTPDVMKSLDKILNKRATSRNYNTVKKIVAKIKD